MQFHVNYRLIFTQYNIYVFFIHITLSDQCSKWEWIGDEQKNENHVGLTVNSFLNTLFKTQQEARAAINLTCGVMTGSCNQLYHQFFKSWVLKDEFWIF